MTSRYSYGGDEHIFVECDEAMSLGGLFFQEPLDHHRDPRSSN